MNFTMVFEQDLLGASVDQSFSSRLTQLFARSFDYEYGTLVVPQIFKRILGTELPFQTVSSDLAQDLVIQRQDMHVGHKFLIYVADEEWSEEMDLTRAEFQRFFQTQLGFESQQIVTLTKAEFGQYHNNFSEETKDALRS